VFAVAVDHGGRVRDPGVAKGPQMKSASRQNVSHNENHVYSIWGVCGTCTRGVRWWLWVLGGEGCELYGVKDPQIDIVAYMILMK
jgi:hypothetical protein